MTGRYGRVKDRRGRDSITMDRKVWIIREQRRGLEVAEMGGDTWVERKMRMGRKVTGGK